MIGGVAAIVAAAVLVGGGILQTHDRSTTSTRQTQSAPQKKPAKKPAAQPVRSFLNPFPQTSVWSSASLLPANPRVDPQSDAKMAYWVANSVVNPSMSLRRYGWAIVPATATAPSYSVKCVIYACAGIGSVRIPKGTVPDPGSDGHLVVYDAKRALEWDFWISHCPDSCAIAGAGNRLSTNKNVPFGAATASGIPGLAGIVHPEEIIKGHIDHPLVFAMPNVRKGYVCPARAGAGSATDPLALPEGTLMQLDPSINVATLPLPRWQKVIARALQQYGMYLEDGSGNLQIGSENPVNRGDLWAKAGLNGDYADFTTDFPWAKMRVLLPPSPWCGK